MIRASRGDAFEKLISARLCVQFARGLSRVVALFNKSCLQPDLAHLGVHPPRYRVPREGYQNRPLSSGMARPVVTIFGECLETK